MSSVSDNVALLLAKLPSTVQLVAVSKLKSPEVVLEAYSAGQRHFGENYVQELIEKAPKLPGDIQWHFIGHLQTNKVKSLLNNVPNLSLIESVDSAKLATALQTVCVALGRTEPLRILVEVCTSIEETKTGVAANLLPALLSHILENCGKLHLCGLMTVADPAASAQSFEILRKLRDEASIQFNLSTSQLGLSMGMSNDWESAVESGSTEVRIGSSIFGSRS